MPAPILVVQTVYAELLERCAAIAFSDAFPEEGAFTPKVIKGRRYWYFQLRTADGRRQQRYAGAETPELLERIAKHREARDDERERRALVSTLVRSFGQPAPLAPIGEIVSALAKAGVFRLRSVLIGTVAYQTYSMILGTKLAHALLQTSDVDIAQFTNVSVAVEDRTPPMLEVLKAVDESFREIPRVSRHARVTSYSTKGGLRVDFLTPNEGPDTDTPRDLPALGTAAQPLRFLDFLIHEPVPAVILHGPGVYIQVPSPERYAVHKIIVAQRRVAGTGKRDKDLKQAEALIEALGEKRAGEFKDAWGEAYARGRTWKQLLLNGMTQLAAYPRDLALKIAGHPREILPGMDLTFSAAAVHYDSTREVVKFVAKALGTSVECAVSREALEEYFGADGMDSKGRVEVFLRNRSKIESLMRVKYLSDPVETPGAVLLATRDVERLQRRGKRRNG